VIHINIIVYTSPYNLDATASMNPWRHRLWSIAGTSG